MADIRIKDLATLESASLTGDVFVIDGTTGTRKLNAFSPTFGGNATVTGTLTVNGTGLSQMAGDANSRLEVGSSTVDQRAHIGLVQRLNLGNPIFSKNLAGKASSDAYTTIGTTAGAGYSGIEFGFGGVIKLLNGTGATTANAEVTPTVSLDTNTTRVNIPLTTASTTTSSGALVVGNGTSGGLGVGGAINAGGAITAGVGTHSFGTSAGGGVNNFGALLTYFNIRSTSDSDNPIFRVYDGRVNVSAFEVNARTGAATVAGTLSVADGGTVSSAGTIRLSNNTSIGWRNAANSADIFLTVNNSNIFSFGSGAPVYVNNTTASTSTSSGALVVSGGVGVAGAMNVGGVITTAAEYLQGSNVNFNIISTATNGNVYLKSNGGILYLNNTVGNGDIRLGNTGTVAYVVGTAASTTTLNGAILVSGGIGVAGAVNAGTFYGLVDGVTAPATESGYARIYVDSADGDLKVKFGDGTVKTIATDS